MSTLQAATISITSNPFDVGRLLSGYFKADINVDTGLLSGQFITTGGTLASAYTNATIAAQLDNVPNITAIMSAPAERHLMFGFHGLDIEAGSGNYTLIGPGSSHMLMGYAFNKATIAYFVFWQDAALVVTPTQSISAPTSGDSIGATDPMGPGTSTPEPVIWPVLGVVFLIGLAWSISKRQALAKMPARHA